MPDDTPLFVRLPREQAERLDRAAFERKRSKRDLVTELVTRHLEVTLDDDRTTVGHASFHPAPPDEVLTLDDCAALLQVAPPEVLALAESGELPARRVGDAWRFRRGAVLAWLGAGEDRA